MKDWAQVKKKIEEEWKQKFSGEIRFDEPMSRHTYYRIGGIAPILLIPQGEKDLEIIAEFLSDFEDFFASREVLILGAGSNLLVSDSGVDALIVKTSRIDLTIEKLPDQNKVATGTSVSISTLLRKCAQEGWGGFEPLVGVPGNVGGAIAMNAGTHLGEVEGILEEVTLFNLFKKSERKRTENRKNLKLGYRSNLSLDQGDVVLSGLWKINFQDPVLVNQKLSELLARRKQTQPLDKPSCGSVFMNPRDARLHAWQVIEKLGLKGHRIGGAEFSNKHGNFITNVENAKASDVNALIQLAKTKAKEVLGITLKEEVKRWGSF